MCLSNTNLFVISGGPGAGKTTLLQELEKRGFPFAPDPPRQIIQEQVQRGGIALPWRDRRAFTLLWLERSIELYLTHTPSTRPTFSERGIPDTLCYARRIGFADEELILDACRRYRYAPVVFLAPLWKEIYETDNERKEEFVEIERTYEPLVEVYSGLGYRLIELPKVSPAQRAQFVLEQLRLVGCPIDIQAVKSGS